MGVHRTSRLARLAAIVAAGATLLGFGVPASQAAVPTHQYDEATALAAADAATGTTYYVSTGGDAANDGTDQTKPTTLDKVNATTFQPGDKILFKAGDTWEATGDAKLDYDNPTALLHPLGSGSADAPIVLGVYDPASGAEVSDYTGVTLPKLQGAARVNDVIQLKDQEHWEIGGFDISNAAEGYTGNEVDQPNKANGQLMGDLRGVHLIGQTKSSLRGFSLHNLTIHEVSGEVAWIGDLATSFDAGRSRSENDPEGDGVSTQTGWNFSKRTGGILIETFKPTDEQNPTQFEDITIEDNDLRQNSFGAITIKQWYGGNGYGASKDVNNPSESNHSNANWRPHRNVTIRNNYINQKGIYNGDGIYLTSVQGALVEHNTVGWPGVCGIELYWTDNVVVQRNEVFEARPKNAGKDSNGIDADRFVTNAIFQYNYVHDNGDGLLICGYEYASVIVRYNVLFNNRSNLIHDYVWGGDVEVFNNVFYQGSDLTDPAGSYDVAKGRSWMNLEANGDAWNVKNNVFLFQQNAVGNDMGGDKFLNKGQASALTFDRNVYVGFAPNNGDAHATVLDTVDQVFAGTLTEKPYPDSLSGQTLNFDALKLSNDALAGTGATYEHDSAQFLPLKDFFVDQSETKDYAGTVINAGDEVDPGIFQNVRTGVGGYVTDAYGAVVVGATVAFAPVDASAKAFETVTTAGGYYSLPDIVNGKYRVKVTLADGKVLVENASAEVTDSTAFTKIDFTEPVAQGTGVSGTVTDASGTPVAGATVELSVSDSRTLRATTDGGGAFAFDATPASREDGFALNVSKDGYQSVHVPGVVVSAGNVTKVLGIVLGAHAEYEAEDQDVAVSSDGATQRVVEERNVGYSGDRWHTMEHATVGSWVSYTFDVATAGTYDLTVFSKNKANRATVQASMDGKDLGAPLAMNTPAIDTRVENKLGAVTLSAGRHELKFMVTAVPGAEGVTGFDNFTLTAAALPSAIIPASAATVGTDAIEVHPAQALVNPSGQGMEYAIVEDGAAFDADAASWQDGTAFAGLKPDTAYRVYARVKASGAVAASVAVASDVIRTGVAVDRSALQSRVDEAKALDPDDYTTTSWLAVQDALKAAQGVLDGGSASQDAMDAALGKLDAAVKALEKRPTSGGNGGGSTGGTTVINKKLVTIAGVAADNAWYDGKAHAGFTGTPSSEFKGTYEVTYTGTGSTKYGPSKTAPTAAGTYRVTVSVPSSDSTWYGSLALEFAIRSGSTAVARFYAPAQGPQGLHMWTASDEESKALGGSGWGSEGTGFTMDSHVGDPVYRLYDARGNQHMWTISVTERDHLISQGWNDEGIAFYQNPTATLDVYRLYNPFTGEHLWTTSLLERDSLSSQSGGDWTYEGVAFKALA